LRDEGPVTHLEVHVGVGVRDGSENPALYGIWGARSLWGWASGGSLRERDRERARKRLRDASAAHALGYIGVCDQVGFS
jgi:hypothetical protein